VQEVGEAVESTPEDVQGRGFEAGAGTLLDGHHEGCHGEPFSLRILGAGRLKELMEELFYGATLLELTVMGHDDLRLGFVEPVAFAVVEFR